jgi:nucleoside-diphosphate-sugar epimerase
MRLLLLGGTGFIGGRVAEQLLRDGHEVAVVHRGRQAPPRGAVSLIVNREDTDPLAEALAAFRPTAIVDMIAYTVRDAERLLAALPAGLQSLTVISSGDVYAAYGAFRGLDLRPEQPGPASEDDALRRSRYPYRSDATPGDELLHDYDKILVEERYQRESPVPVTILRLPMVYGPGDPHGRLDAEVARLRGAPGGVLELHPDEAGWRCTRGYVEDVALAVGLAATHPGAAGRTYNVGEAEALTTVEWLTSIATAIGSHARIVSTGSAAPSQSVDWSVPVITATDRIRRELGFVELVGRPEGLRRTILPAEI